MNGIAYFLELNGILITFISFYLKDPISAFANFIKHNKDEESLSKFVESWNNRIKITSNDLIFTKDKKFIKYVKVRHRTDLANKYLGHFVSCCDEEDHINILNDKQIRIIDRNKSVILYCDDKRIGAVIRDAAPKNVLNHFGVKIKSTIDVHYTICRGKSHKSVGDMVGYGTRPNFLDGHSGSYSYKKKASDPDTQRIFDDDRNTLANWLYNYGKKYLPFTTLSYDEFKEKVKLDNDEVIGAVFCTKNYQAVGHKDKDRSEFAVGFVYDEETCWSTKAVHGTAKLDLSEGGTRYTAVITLTEKTARAIEKDKNILK
ncbi:unnamed protein product [Rhizophagus irregularis]|nr:unnamed protein product [Rhizophagus irregularis]CAB5316788.1 unnamed protein product [Rhizophagus irregularis]